MSNSRPFWMKTNDTEPTALPIGPAVSQAEAEGDIVCANGIEVLPPEALACINAKGIAFGTASQLKSELMTAFGDAASVLSEAAAIKVTSVDQIAEMAKAKALRLRLKAIRCAVEKVRKELKADSVLRGRAIDGAANAVKGVIEPAEAWLLEQEQFAERIEEQRLADLRKQRAELLAPFVEPQQNSTGATPPVIDLADLTPEAFSALLEGYKMQAQIRAETEKTAEAARLAEEATRKAKEVEAEKERQRLKAENDRLQEENRKANAEADRIRKEAADAKEAADRISADKARLEKAEAARLAEIERKAASAPDKEKALAFAASLRVLALPDMASQNGESLKNGIAELVEKLAVWIETQANSKL